jgi:hypothetical protein
MMEINSLIEQTEELLTRFRGLESLKTLFPQEYAKLSPKLVLNDNTLSYLDDRLFELLNQDYFPCYYYDYSTNSKQKPYEGIKNIAIEPMGFNGYDWYYYGEGASWYFIYTNSDRFFDYYDYNGTGLLWIENQLINLPNYHPLQLLPDAVRYVWSMTGNLWLDSHLEGNNEFEFTTSEIVNLKQEYEEALEKLELLLFFDRWFTDNVAVAKLAINKVMQQIANQIDLND